MADSFVLGLVVGFAAVIGATGLVWVRNGRDPRSPDDPSLLAAAPPPGMTAATATLVLDRPAHEAFVAALLDLATRDEIRFESEGVEDGADRVGIAIRGGESDDPRVLLARRLPIGEAEAWLLAQLRLAVTGRGQAGPHGGGHDDHISAAGARTLGEPFMFGTLLGTSAKRRGWTAGVTGIRRAKWRIIGIGEIVLGMVVSVVATNVFSEGLVGLAMGIGLGGGVTYMVAGSMAARTRESARMRTQLSACARALRATFTAAATMDDVVADDSLRWLASADQALVWGIALGLRPEIEALLARSTAVAGLEAAARPDEPTWFVRHGRRAPGAAPMTGDPATMFAGIALIGSEASRGPSPGTTGGTPG